MEVRIVDFLDLEVKLTQGVPNRARVADGIGQPRGVLVRANTDHEGYAPFGC